MTTGVLRRPELRALNDRLRSTGYAVSAGMVVLFVAVHLVVFLPLGWHHSDMDAYWFAGERLRAGQQLYTTLGSTDAAANYIYAPWFAWIWAGLAAFPRPIVDAAWVAALVAASAAILRILWQPTRAGFLFWLLMIPPILMSILSGNVQPLIVLAVLVGLDGRSGPLFIAMAATMKVTPILFVVVYVARREWGKAIATLALTALLTAPVLFYDLSGYASSAGFFTPPMIVIAAAGVIGAFSVARWRPEWAPFAAAAATVMANPRNHLYTIMWIIPGVAGRPELRARTSPAASTGEANR